MARPSSYSEEIAEIYALCDPRTGEVRYIGKARDSQARLMSHLREKRRGHYPVYCWIAKLRAEGLSPELRVLETCAVSDWPARERALIAAHENLLNVAEGGNEPQCSRDTRQRNGRKVSALIHGDARKKQLWRVNHMLGVLRSHGYANGF
jgi:hypothetical protein